MSSPKSVIRGVIGGWAVARRGKGMIREIASLLPMTLVLSLRASAKHRHEYSRWQSPLEQKGIASSAFGLLAMTDSGVVSHRVALCAMDKLGLTTLAGQEGTEKQATAFAAPSLLEYNPLEHSEQLRT